MADTTLTYRGKAYTRVENDKGIVIWYDPEGSEVDKGLETRLNRTWDKQNQPPPVPREKPTPPTLAPLSQATPNTEQRLKDQGYSDEEAKFAVIMDRWNRGLAPTAAEEDFVYEHEQQFGKAVRPSDQELGVSTPEPEGKQPAKKWGVSYKNRGSINPILYGPGYR